MTWAQEYDPCGNLYLSALVAGLPVVVLLGLLGLFKVRAYVAALSGLASALFIAVGVFGMPASLAAAAAGYGVAYGLFPIGWIVLNAIFIYDVTVRTGKFEIVKHGIAALASDRRIQALLIAFSFGRFYRRGRRFWHAGRNFRGPSRRPRLQTASGRRALPSRQYRAGRVWSSWDAADCPGRRDGHRRQSVERDGRTAAPVFFAADPVLAGHRHGRSAGASRGVARVPRRWWKFCRLAVSRLSNYNGPLLVDIISSVVSMLALVVLLRFWQPRNVWRFEHERNSEIDRYQPSRRDSIVAWMPWVLLCAFVFAWGVPSVKKQLEKAGTIKVEVPLLHKAVIRRPPVVREDKQEEAVFSLDTLSATGTALLFAGIVAGFMLKLTPAALASIYRQTFLHVIPSLLTIAAMLALGYTTRYSGLDTTMGLAFAGPGGSSPFFSPVLGWLGVALTGSDTASNVLFGNLQQVAAGQIGVSAVLTAAANSSGGVMGKMIDAQSLVVASVATESIPVNRGGAGKETAVQFAYVSPADVLRFVFFHSITLALLVGVVVLLQAYVFPWMIPSLPATH